MTRARIVTLGQAMAMTPTMRASTPRTIKEVDAFLSMMGSFRWVSRTHGRPIRHGDPTPGSNTAIGTAFGRGQSCRGNGGYCSGECRLRGDLPPSHGDSG